MVYTEIVPDCAKQTLQAIIRGRVELESVIHSDSYRGYNGLVDLGYKKHYRVHMETMSLPMAKDTSMVSNPFGPMRRGDS